MYIQNNQPQIPNVFMKGNIKSKKLENPQNKQYIYL